MPELTLLDERLQAKDLKARTTTAPSWHALNFFRDSKKDGATEADNLPAKAAVSSSKLLEKLPAEKEKQQQGTFLSSSNSRKSRQMLKSAILSKAKHQIHILHCLPGRALNQIVQSRNDNKPRCSLINAKSNVAVV